MVGTCTCVLYISTNSCSKSCRMVISWYALALHQIQFLRRKPTCHFNMSVKYTYIYLQGVPGLSGTEGAKYQWHKTQTPHAVCGGWSHEQGPRELQSEPWENTPRAALRENPRSVQCLHIWINVQVPGYANKFHTMNAGLFYYYMNKDNRVIWEKMHF